MSSWVKELPIVGELVNDEKELLFLGGDTLKFVIERINCLNNNLCNQKDEIHEELAMISHRDLTNLSALPSEKVIRNNKSYRIPVGFKQLKMKPKSATFIRCGWCKYFEEEETHYDCKIAGKCLILSDPTCLEFDSVCSVKERNPFFGCRRSDSRDLTKKIQKNGDLFRQLVPLANMAENKPVIPTGRKNVWAMIEEEFFVYFGQIKDCKVDNWQKSRLLDFDERLRFLDLHFENPVVKNKIHGSYTFKLDIENPLILQRPELCYLSNNPDFAKIWLDLCPELSDEFKDAYLTSIKNLQLPVLQQAMLELTD
jgi:hypothetical protein